MTANLLPSLRIILVLAHCEPLRQNLFILWTTKLDLVLIKSFCFRFRHAMSQAYVRYFLYTFRYIATAQELFNFIREKCSASLR